MNYSFTFLESHYRELKTHLIREDGKERAAFIICGRASSTNEERFLSRELVLLDGQDLITSHPSEVSWDNNLFISALKKAESKGFAVALIHNHSGYRQFSHVDDEGEYHLFRLAFNRNGNKKPYASLIMMEDGALIGRAWLETLSHQSITKFRVIGKRFQLDYPGRTDSYLTNEAFHRQSLAFGKSLVQDFSKLKIAIVGVGATGSATAVLLARLGVGELCLIDKDQLEVTNLNRVHGARLDDVGKPKVDVLKSHIESYGLGTQVSIIKDWVSSKDSIEQLKNSDIIFGCTDDHAGRIVLNRFAYFYLIPVIDMGLVISVSNSSPPEIQDLQGRYTYLFPGNDCLLTRGVINQDRAISENLKRSHPDRYAGLKKEAYVMGEGNPAPAVVTFTTQIAAMAVNSLLNRMTGYNEFDYSPHKIVFFHRSTELNPGNVTNNHCRICSNNAYWGRGDMEPFLDMSL